VGSLGLTKVLTWYADLISVVDLFWLFLVLYDLRRYTKFFYTIFAHHFTRGGLSEAQNGYTLCMLLGYGPPNLQVSSSALICRFQCSWAWNVQITGAIPNRPRREPYFLSSHMLYLTSQRIKLSDFWCFGILRVNKDHCKRNGAKRKVVGEVCKLMCHSPLKAPI
jgi:hypothetical protein